MSKLRLGINIDHVATVRNARGGAAPDPVRAAHLAIQAGADGITAHLREDRRHIRDDDMRRLKAEIAAPLNFEMAATDEMVAIALATRPHASCIVPEKRSERTTEGGLDVIGGHDHLKIATTELSKVGIRVSLFIEPTVHAIRGRQIDRRAGRRAAYRRLVRQPHPWRDRARCARVRAHQDRRARGEGGRHRMPCRPWPRLCDGPEHQRPAGDRGAEHRPFSRSARRSSSGSPPRSAPCAPRWRRRRAEAPR